MKSLKLQVLLLFFFFPFESFLHLQSFWYSLLPSLEVQSIHNGNQYYSRIPDGKGLVFFKLKKKKSHFWFVFHNVTFFGVAETMMYYIDVFLHVNYKPCRSLVFYLCCSACLCTICFYQVSCALCCHPSYCCLSLRVPDPLSLAFYSWDNPLFQKAPSF